MKKNLSRRRLLAGAAALAAVPAAALAQDTTAPTQAATPPATPDPNAAQATPPAAPADAAAAPVEAAPQPAGPGVALSIGTYGDDASGGGLYPIGSYISSDDFHVWPAKPGIDNASWGVWGGPKRLYYVVNEQAAGMIGVYDAGWNKVGEVSSQGDSPCHLAISGQWLACANYNTGNVVFFPLDPTTGLPGAPVIRQNRGKSKDPDRQAGPHAHFVAFAPGNSNIFSVDLGTDEILNYTFDGVGGKIGQKTTALHMPRGSGPRHMVFHPDGVHVYIVSELANTVTVCEQSNMTTLDAKQTISTLPKDFTGHSQAGEIALNHRGNRLYVSNRGHNSISVFNVADDGKLTPLQTVSCGGDWPRMFVLLEDQYLAAQPRLIVANQNSNNVVPFRVQPDGTLVQQGKILDVPKPVFIGFEIQG